MRKERGESKAKAYIVIFIAFILVTSIIGFLYNGNTSGSRTVNGKKFYPTDKGWLLTLDRAQYVFSYLPDEIGSIPADASLALKNSPMIYITYGPEDENGGKIAQMQYDLGLALVGKNIYVQNGFTENNSYRLPIITCANATLQVPVLYMGTSGNLSVSYESGCIRAESDSENFLRLRDSLLYAVLGVI
ncbi:hypothetical protein HY638_02005 [Candidatus Woesearchaeota archaeon]|nr:hypothetical protein [Candidatus Woesearchaeota archaeon]